MILNVYRKILNDLGFEPVLFQFPTDLLAWIQEEIPKAIFTDLNMPMINGIELTKRIRQQYSKEELPVIMISTQQDEEDIQEADSKGVNRFLHKPFNSDDIRNTLISVFDR